MVARKQIVIFVFILLLLPSLAQSAEKSRHHFPLKAALLVEMDSGKILYQFNPDRLIQPASLSKILTLYLVNEDIRDGKVNLSDRVKVSALAVSIRGSKMLREEGIEVSLEDLLSGIAIISANDATVSVAEHLEGSVDKFVERMNAKAKELGMKQSYFVNPHGLPNSHQVTTAHDIFILSREYLKQFPEALNLHSMQYFTYHSVIHHNQNSLLWDYPDVDGLKTGFIRVAGFHIVATAKRGDKRLIAVVMGAKNKKIRSRQTKEILDYGFRQLGYKHHKSIVGAGLPNSGTQPLL
jgi:D-alanyl-D-alanine carboxypeptidase (penicillin-binding protein 5/6)